MKDDGFVIVKCGSTVDSKQRIAGLFNEGFAQKSDCGDAKRSH
jgi:hypothetical protein